LKIDPAICGSSTNDRDELRSAKKDTEESIEFGIYIIFKLQFKVYTATQRKIKIRIKRRSGLYAGSFLPTETSHAPTCHQRHRIRMRAGDGCFAQCSA
jgi:hypothetical protein